MKYMAHRSLEPSLEYNQDQTPLINQVLLRPVPQMTQFKKLLFCSAGNL